MILSSLSVPTAVLLLAQTTAPPGYFTPVLFALFAAGTIGALVATLMGFRRAPAFGASTRWFALAALCLLLYHAQFVVLIVIAFFGVRGNDFSLAFGFVPFFNLFVALATVCAVMGFVRLTDPR